jgi:hypothetical protein
VNAQSSSSSSAGEVRFAINLAAVPLPRWKWHSHQIGGNLDRAVKEHDGLYGDRLRPSAQHASGPDQTWWSVTDDDSAERAGADVARALDQDGLPILLRLLDRREMLEAARRGELGFGLRDVRGAVAVLLTAEAPSGELAALLDELKVLEDARLRSKYRPLVDWCRATVQTAHRREPAPSPRHVRTSVVRLDVKTQRSAAAERCVPIMSWLMASDLPVLRTGWRR